MMLILLLCVSIVVITISMGIINAYKNENDSRKKVKKALKINVSAFLFVMTTAILLLIPDIANAATTGTMNSENGIGFIAAALSTGIATLGAGYAVAATGSAALGAISEDSKILGKTLIFVGLAEGIAIYGLIISIMILSKF